GDGSLGLVTPLSDFLAHGDTRDAVSRSEARAENLQSQLRNGARTARTMGDLTESAIPLLDSAQRIIDTPRPSLSDTTRDGITDISASSDALEIGRASCRERVYICWCAVV